MNAPSTANVTIEDHRSVSTSDMSAATDREHDASTTASSAPDGADGKNKGLRISSSLKRVIDETQLSPEEAERLQTRRAYNRECATRARKRTKNLVTTLQDEVRNLQADKDDLRRENAVMRAQLETLEKQNQTLAFKQTLVESQMGQPYGMPTMGSGVGGGYMPLMPRMNLDTALNDLLASHQAASATRNPLVYRPPSM